MSHCVLFPNLHYVLEFEICLIILSFKSNVIDINVKFKLFSWFLLIPFKSNIANTNFQ